MKSKQLDMNDISNSIAVIIGQNNLLKKTFQSLFMSTFLSYVFSTNNSNIQVGQTIFNISYLQNPINIFIFRNGLKLINGVDYNKTYNNSSITITLINPIVDIDGVTETIEINYY